ncbi:MAG TPA: hypothetical protein VN605_09410, partial [Thermoanaerobaculia bacterium]|nr:hypothetical protein [Thermoanaerobaculia bacterium]
GDGDPVLTPAELAEDRAKLYARIAASERQRRDRWLRFAPLAAAVLLAAWVVQLQLKVSDAHQPRIAKSYLLRPLRTMRSPAASAPVTLPADEEMFRIAPKLNDAPPFREYRVNLLDTSSSRPRVVWSQVVGDTEPLEVTLHRDYLGDGTFHLDVEGRDGAGEWQPVGRYAFRVAAR